MNTIKEYRLLTIKEGNLKTSYEEHNQNSGRTSLITIENRDGVHADLEAALQRLAIHMKQMLNIPAVVDLTLSGSYKQPSGNAMLITFYAKLDNEGKANQAVR